jgi:hypothetical protein
LKPVSIVAQWQMIRIIQRVNRFLILGAILTILGSAMLGGCKYFPESTFTLANESRLPKWITLPSGRTRTDVSITMSYYDNPWGSNVSITLQDATKQVLVKAYGKEKDGGPFHLKHPPQGFPPGYPLYEVITANGIPEIIEHRKMEPIVYITDDPIVWKELMGAQPTLQ